MRYVAMMTIVKRFRNIRRRKPTAIPQGIVKEFESKCDILRENCSLLREKVVFLSERHKISTKHEDKISLIRSTSKSPQPKKKTTTESKQPYSAVTVATKIPNHAETSD
ncbi:hypothetical protein JTB14_033228 [Gonioctena quinquepunctata]|nr:hypothetical protein JTB14_033228 [Gonioctena quinquepunctata]